MAKETKNGRKKKKENTPSLTTLQPLPKSNEQKSKIPGMIKVTGIDKIGTPRPSNRCLVLVSSSLPRNIHSTNNFSAYNTNKITGRQIAPDANATKSPSIIGTL